jgi:hypothetical protein
MLLKIGVTRNAKYLITGILCLIHRERQKMVRKMKNKITVFPPEATNQIESNQIKSNQITQIESN